MNFNWYLGSEGAGTYELVLDGSMHLLRKGCVKRHQVADELGTLRDAVNLTVENKT